MENHENAVYRVGDATITKISELTLEGIPASYLYPGSDPVAAEAAGRDLDPASIDPLTGLLRLGVHAWLVHTPAQVILVDTASGNDKTRSGSPAFNQLNEPFLARLKAAGASPEEVDVVLHTHLHVDHVGWNTHRVDGRWIPTFPKARHVFSGRERAYLAALAMGGDAGEAIRAEAKLGPMAALPDFEFFQDSIVPVIEAGLAREIAVDGTEVMEGFSYLPSPGHSIDHACISFVSQGERALFWGDVMHNPIQFAQPDWNSVYCEFPDAARQARRWAVAHAADTDSLVFTTHFAGSSVGRVSRDDGRLTWRFA
jgi:glyoxylase-like metal-dependent hydrolase (beta-lactamase superfamily II)